MIPISGTVAPQFEAYGWQNINDNDDATFAQTTNSNGAYMELDYGESEQPLDKVHVSHRSDVCCIERSNGVKLFVIGVNCEVIFENLFSGITKASMSTLSVDFTIPVHASLRKHGRLVRFLRLTRTTGSDHMMFAKLEAYQDTRTWLYFVKV